ncbi:hypothetical protein Tco_1037340 [Tanacetum coccineum]
MLLAQAHEAKVILQEEQHDFLADGLEEFDSDCDDLLLNTTSIFKADHVDAFDSDCDEAPTASAIFIARLSSAGSVNEDDVSPTYDSDILFEYMVTIENDTAQSVPSSKQNNDNLMILSVIKQMQSQVERCNMENQETITERHDPISVYDSKETLILAEEKQVYWLPPVSKPKTPMSVDKPTPQKGFLKKLSTTNMVKDSLQKVKNNHDKFDVCIKDQTVIFGIHYGSWGVSHIKDAYEEEVILFVKNLKESFTLFEKGLYKEVNEMKSIFKQMENEVD